MWLAAASLLAIAAVAPSFDPDASAWSATDVVVVSEGVAIDGEVTVLESWKGDLPLGGVHAIAGLAELGKAAKGGKLVLFLRRSGGGDAPRLEPAASWGGLEVSLAWLEGGRARAFVQGEDGGPLLLADVGSELELQARVTAVARLQADLRATSAIGDLDQRVRALTRFAREPIASAEAFQLLGGCAQAAVPALLELMSPEVGLAPQAAEVLAQLPGPEGQAALVSVLADEHAFWSARGPSLPDGWWDAQGAAGELLRRRYGRVLVSVEALGRLRAEAARPWILRHAELWTSLPALAATGDGQVPAACQRALQALEPPS